MSEFNLQVARDAWVVAQRKPAGMENWFLLYGRLALCEIDRLRELNVKLHERLDAHLGCGDREPEDGK